MIRNNSKHNIEISNTMKSLISFLTEVDDSVLKNDDQPLCNLLGGTDKEVETNYCLLLTNMETAFPLTFLGGYDNVDIFDITLGDFCALLHSNDIYDKKETLDVMKNVLSEVSGWAKKDIKNTTELEELLSDRKDELNFIFSCIEAFPNVPIRNFGPFSLSETVKKFTKRIIN